LQIFLLFVFNSIENRAMKKLDILIFRSYIKPLLATFSISIFILLMQFLWKYMEDMVGKGLDWSVIAELLIYSTAGLVPLALPLSILMSSLMTFGNMGQNYELLALKAAGISLKRAMMPLIFFSALMSLGAFFFANNVLPYTQLKSLSLLYDVTHKKPELNIKTGIFNNDLEGYTLKVKYRDKETGIMHNLMLYDHTNDTGNNGVTLADSARMLLTNDKKYMLFILYSGESYQELTGTKKNAFGYPLQRDTFQMKQILIPMVGFELNRTNEELFAKNFQMLNVQQLDYAIDSLYSESKRRNEKLSTDLQIRNYFTTKLKDSTFLTRFDKKPDYFKNLSNDSLPILINTDSLLVDKPSHIRELAFSDALERANSVQLELKHNRDYDIEQVRYIRRHEIEWHKKYVLAFATFLFFFIGAPLGAIIRKGGMGMPVVVSALFFVAYYIVALTGEKLVRESILPAFEGMWLASFILLPLGIYFTYIASYDSSIMESETYLKFFDKIDKLFNKMKFGVTSETQEHIL